MDKKIKIKNRSQGIVAYTIPEVGDIKNVRREFAAKEVKEITLKELEALTFVPGGKVLLEEYLQILDQDAIGFVEMEVEPEYNMSEEDVIELLKNGSYEKFLDVLDFAPIGVIDLIKHYAVELPCNDTAKRDALLNKTGFNVDAALKIKKEANEENNEVFSEKKRRVPVEATPAVPARPKYNIVG